MSREIPAENQGEGTFYIQHFSPVDIFSFYVPSVLLANKLWPNKGNGSKKGTFGLTTPSPNQNNKSIQICHLLLRFRFPFLVYMQKFMNSFCPIQFCLKIKPCMYFFGLNRRPFWWYVCFPNGMYVFRLLDFQYDVPQHPLFLQGDDLSSNGWNVFHLFSLNNASRYFTFWNVWKSFVIRICS